MADPTAPPPDDQQPNPYAQALEQRQKALADNPYAQALAARTLQPGQNAGLGGDVVTSLKRGVESIPGAATGLLDVAAGLAGYNRPFERAADALGEATGFQPGKWAEQAQKEYSPGWQQAAQEINEAWNNPQSGALDVAKAYATNPRYVLSQAIESVPPMIAGGAGPGRAAGVLAKAAGRTLSREAEAGIGEGALMAGQDFQQIDPGVDPQRAAAAALGIGVLGGAIGYGSGRLARHYGWEDVDTVGTHGRDPIAQAAWEAAHPPKPFYQRIPAGIVQEGAEEVAQTIPEQGLQNWAEDKPLTQDMARQVVESGLAGGLMGGAFNALPHRSANEQPTAPPTQPLTRAAQAGILAGAVAAAPVAPPPAAPPATPAAAVSAPAPVTPSGPAGAAAPPSAGGVDDPFADVLPAGKPPTGPAVGPLSAAVQNAAAAGVVSGAGPSFASWQDARDASLAAEQAARQPALPLARGDGSFGVAQQGTPDWQLAQQQARERMKGIAQQDRLRETEARARAEAQQQDKPAKPEAPLAPFDRVQVTLNGQDQFAQGTRVRQVTRDEQGADWVQVEGSGSLVPSSAVRLMGPGERAAPAPAAAPSAAPAAPAPSAAPPAAASGQPPLTPQQLSDLFDEASGELAAEKNAATSPDTQGISPHGAQATETQQSQPQEAPGQAPGVAPQILSAVDEGAHQAASSPLNDKPAPTKGQILGESAELGHARIGPLDVSFENPAGTVREDKHHEPPEWRTEMRGWHYGYIKRTVAADSTPEKAQRFDVFVKEGTPDDYNGPVYVLDQVDPATGKFDEHKGIIGVASEAEARAAYQAHYEPDWRGLGGLTAFPTVGAFNQWVKDGAKNAALTDLGEWQPPATAAPAAENASKTAGGEQAAPEKAIAAVHAALQSPYDERNSSFIPVDRSRLEAAIEQAKAAGVRVEQRVPENREYASTWNLTTPAGDSYTAYLHPTGRGMWKQNGRVEAPAAAPLIEQVDGETGEIRQIDPETGEIVAGAPAAAPPAENARKPLSVGVMPNRTEPVSVREGVIHIGDHPALDYDTGEPVAGHAGMTDAQLRQALKDAGALSKHQKFFAGGPAEEAPATPAETTASAPAAPGAGVAAPASGKPRLAESADDLYRAIAATPEVVVEGRGTVPVIARIVGGGGDYRVTKQDDGATKLQRWSDHGIGVRDATPAEQTDFHDALEKDQVQVLAVTRPGYSSGGKTPQTLRELHSPSGNGFKAAQATAAAPAESAAPAPARAEVARQLVELRKRVSVLQSLKTCLGG
jgi:hypothetical protein